MTTTIESDPAGDESAASPPEATPVAPLLDVVVPVYNEQDDLERAVRRLHQHLATQVPYTSRITIADNASTDATLAIAQALTVEYDDVRVVHLDAKGRGRALNQVWQDSDAQIVAYCDVDLSTDLNALMPLIAPLVSGHSDVAIGTRLSRSAKVVRGAKREFISRSYNLILRLGMRTHFTDAQCGFKAMRTEVARQLLPHVEDTGWFWDTEMLVLAERIGLRIAEVPVDWVDDPDSSVDILATAVADLKGCARVGWALASGRLPIEQLRRNLGRERDDGPELTGVPAGMAGQVIRFVSVGVASTIAFALLYLLLHTHVGAQTANFLALAITAVLNTAANRRFTFGVRGRTGLVRHHLFGWAVFLFGWAVTAGSLAALHLAVPDSSRGVELAVLIIANLVATATRFAGLRWIFVRRNQIQENNA